MSLFYGGRLLSETNLLAVAMPQKSSLFSFNSGRAENYSYDSSDGRPQPGYYFEAGGM
ncbi:hypothetical protein FOMA001_g8838 [Fusarium oxysporum f. sp. matthiolae]|nr:hypothetical protein FOMA001_g8838 [Fusarium oxysporum f. sp. matthiolae]